MQSFLLALQRILAPKKQQIERGFLAAELALLGVWVIVAVMLRNGFLTSGDVYQLGANFGLLGLGWYVLTLIPGILSRLQMVPLAGAVLTLFRRHFGIMMFTSIFLHFSFTTLLPIVLLEWPTFIDTARIFGFLAFLTTFPLWLTSNSTSERFLGKRWKLLHRLTYLIMVFIFGHLAFFGKQWAILVAVVIGAELLSWAVYWRRQRIRAAASPTRVSSAPASSPPAADTSNMV